jgi:hypothetical protein
VLKDTVMRTAIGQINRQVLSLAPMLNSPTITDGAVVAVSNPQAPVTAMVKQCQDTTYLFAVAMRDSAVTATFTLKGKSGGRAEVLGEQRTLPVKKGAFKDAFKPYEVHLYKVRP